MSKFKGTEKSNKYYKKSLREIGYRIKSKDLKMMWKTFKFDGITKLNNRATYDHVHYVVNAYILALYENQKFHNKRDKKNELDAVVEYMSNVFLTKL